MTNKLYLGIAAGILVGLSIPVLIKYRRDSEMHSDEDTPNDNDSDMLDKANHYLMLAKNKVDEMVAEASLKSDSYIEEAGKILSTAKEKTSSIHYDLKETAEEEINKIKAEIDLSIEEFKKRMQLNNE